MKNPKIKLKLGIFDILLEIGGITCLAVLFYVVLSKYGDLPDTIPVHFDASGEVDGHGSKSSLLMLSGIALLSYVGLFILNQFPHIFNLPVTITENNAERQYRLATRLIRVMNVSVTFLFLYIIYSMIGSSSDHQLGMLFLPIILSTMAVIMIVYFFLAVREKN